MIVAGSSAEYGFNQSAEIPVNEENPLPQALRG